MEAHFLFYCEFQYCFTEEESLSFQRFAGSVKKNGASKQKNKSCQKNLAINSREVDVENS